jgi:DNA modification methylase
VSAIFQGDIREWTKQYTGEKFHAMLTDPPYHLGSKGFMGSKWDAGGKQGFAFDVEMWASVRELMYPGAVALVFSGSYNSHRVTIALEDAGWEIYPMIAWVHSQGMGLGRRVKATGFSNRRYGKQALRPCVEPIICAVNPSASHHNAVTFGTGTFAMADTGVDDNDGAPKGFVDLEVVGRDPSNVILSEYAAESVGAVAGREINKLHKTIRSDWSRNTRARIEDTPKAVYCPKASRREKDTGLEEYISVDVGVLSGRRNKTFTDGRFGVGKNDHETVKPIALDEYLARLIVPPAHIKSRMLNPFSGSGTELAAGVMAGFNEVIGIELSGRFTEMAQKRIAGLTGIAIDIVQQGETS